MLLTGLDIVEIRRMERFLEKFDTKALQRFLHVEEIELVHSAKTAAGFWAVKEACAKALGVGISKECSFFDMKIYKDAKKAPKLALSRSLTERFGITSVALSITHDGDYAAAVVTLLSSAPDKVEQF